MNADRSFAIKKAILLREKGYSLQEIATLLHISKSTASLWVRNVSLSAIAIAKLKERSMVGAERYKEFVIKRRKNNNEKMIKTANNILKYINFNPELYKLLCSLLFWAEGSKKTTQLKFTNSDPLMIKVFLGLLRSFDNIDETKFRALIHLHEYHDEHEIKTFWSTVTKIPLVQFNKSYLKKNTRKRTKEGYKGCITITYYSASIAHELTMLYNIFAQMY